MRRLLSLTLVCGMVFYTPVSAVAKEIDESLEIERYVNARLAEMDGRSGDALKSYQILFKTNPDSAAVTNRLLNSAIRSGDMVSAVSAVRMQELRNQTDGTATMLLFADAFRKKNWPAAQIAIAELQAKSNYAFIAPVLTSWVNVATKKKHNFNPVNTNNQQLLNYYSSDQRVYFELSTDNFAAAKTMLPAFANLDTDFARDLIIRSTPILSVRGEISFAKDMLGNLVEQSYVSGLTSDTQTKFATKLTPEQGLATLYSRLSSSLLEQKAPDQALILSRIANWLDPASDPAKLVLARALQENGLNNSQQDVLSAISMKSPYWPRAVADQVRMLASTNRRAEALQYASLAQKQIPSSVNLILLTGQMYEDAGDPKSATVYYTQIINQAKTQNISPRQQAMYLLFLATAQDKSGQWESAFKNLQDANAIDPDNAYILNYLGYGLLERNEKLDKAFGYVKRAHQLAPQSAAITDSLGWGYYLIGQYSQALPLLEKAARASGSDSAINEHLGDVYWQLNRRIDARYAWKTALQGAEEKDGQRLQEKIDIGLRTPARKL